jgi:hypothetical protein
MTLEEAKTLNTGDVLTDEEERRWAFLFLLDNGNLWMEDSGGRQTEHVRECYELF